MAVANARAYTERAQIARTLQASLRPPDLPEIEGWDIACLHEPAGEANDVGGDFFEVFEVAGGWMAMIGDVEGKGAAAASVTAVARHTLHAVAQLTGDALTAVRQLDRRLRGGPENDLCSVALVQLRGAGRLRALGGPSAADARDRERRAEIDVTGPLPGRAARAGGVAVRARGAASPGDALVLYTDGVTDAVGAGGERFGPERLLATLAEPAAARGRSSSGSRPRCGVRRGRAQRDDVACLVLRRR